MSQNTEQKYKAMKIMKWKKKSRRIDKEDITCE